jgi:hypothetical protein
MDEEIERLRRVIAKTFRKAKRWYLTYVLSQFVVFGLTLGSVFVDVGPRMSAVIAFIGVLITEGVRWRSDYWKGEGDSAKRRWELADGLGMAVDDGAIADWLALRPAGFLDDVTDEELSGSDFDSDQPPGPRRLVESTRESAWWSKHESRRIAWYFGIGLGLLLAAIFAALTTVISRLQVGIAGSDPTTTKLVGVIICVVLAFIFSINVVRLLVEFIMFYHSSKAIVERSGQLLQKDEPNERDALLLLFDYQISRSNAPLLPTFIWKIHGSHLSREWKRFRKRG